MTDSCVRCGAAVTSYEGALGVALYGFGDAGIIDTFNTEIAVVVCEVCARALFAAETWLLTAAAPVLNINYGHTCDDGIVHWVAESKCSIDPDRHGWATKHAVIPMMDQPPGKRAPLTTPAGKMARFGVFDDIADARALTATLLADGISCRTAETLSGNERNHSAVVEPREWLSWWELHNKRWVRTDKVRTVRHIAEAFARQPLRMTALTLRRLLG